MQVAETDSLDEFLDFHVFHFSSCLMSFLQVWLENMKPFGKPFDPILFKWRELIEHDPKKYAAKEAALSSSSSSSSSTPIVNVLPADDGLQWPFRLIPSSSAGMDVLRASHAMLSRFPKQGYDLSDKEAIERFVQRVSEGDLKQSQDE